MKVWPDVRYEAFFFKLTGNMQITGFEDKNDKFFKSVWTNAANALVKKPVCVFYSTSQTSQMRAVDGTKYIQIHSPLPSLSLSIIPVSQPCRDGDPPSIFLSSHPPSSWGILVVFFESNPI
jgi:hypothetical protein